MVLCCICGVEVGVGGVHSGRCVQCLQKEVDITAGINRQVGLHRCNTCERFQKPGGGGGFAHAALESRELLSICLKAVRGISKEHQVIDAAFLWTEPHSKELRVKIVLQKEIVAGVFAQQTLTVEYRVGSLQCLSCKKLYTRHTWESNVQVRQRTDHKRTLLNLEQLILKHKAHANLIKVETTKDGVDFFFTRERDAQDFVAFVRGISVAKHQESKHLVSHNMQNAVYRYKRTTCVEICPVCRDDLIFLSPKLMQALGGVAPVMLCTRASTYVGLLDPFSGRALEVGAVDYWKRPFTAAFSQSQLTLFVVLDVSFSGIEAPTGRGGARGTPMQLFDVEIARVADFGRNEERITVRTNLGNLLQPGDHALGYDLRTLNTGLDDEEWQRVPMEVYLVRKHRPDRKMLDAAAVEAGAAPKKPSRKKGGRGQRDRVEAPNPLLGHPEPATDSDVAGDDDEDQDEEARDFERAAGKMLDALGKQGQDGEPTEQTDALNDADDGFESCSVESVLEEGTPSGQDRVDTRVAPESGDPRHGEPAQPQQAAGGKGARGTGRGNARAKKSRSSGSGSGDDGNAAADGPRGNGARRAGRGGRR